MLTVQLEVYIGYIGYIFRYLDYTVNMIMDTEVLPAVAKKQKQLSMANFFGGANNAIPSRNAEVVQLERKTPTTPNYVGQARLVPTETSISLSHLAGGLQKR